MKTVSSILSAVLMTAMLVLGTGVDSDQSKLAHLDTQKILESMASYKEAVKKFEKFEKEGFAELEAMKADFDRSVNEFTQKVQSGSFTPQLQQFEEQKLAKKEEDLLARQQSLQVELQAYSHELNQPILDRLELAVKLVSDRHKYDYVFEESTLIVHNGHDITAEVIKEILKLETRQ